MILLLVLFLELQLMLNMKLLIEIILFVEQLCVMDWMIKRCVFTQLIEEETLYDDNTHV